MEAVRIDVVRFIDGSYPGFVECRLVDAQGRELLFHEKVPVVSAADLDADSLYPQPGFIACQTVERYRDADGQEIVRIDTAIPWDIESTTGETQFEILAEQLTDIS